MAGITEHRPVQGQPVTDILKRPKVAESGSLTKESVKATKSGSQSADKDVEMEGPKWDKERLSFILVFLT